MRKQTCPTLVRGWLGVLLALALTTGGLMAAERECILRGRVTDTDDNWLPDVRVELKRAGAVTNTDPNGLFELKFKAPSPMTADRRGVYDILALDKEGHLGRSIQITDPAYFEKPVVEKMEPNPVGEDNVGFSVRLPVYQSIHGLTRQIKGFEKGDPIEAERFESLFERKSGIDPQGPKDRVSFHAYIPRGAERVRAAFLISLHGMGTIDHPRLRDFADRNAVALIGVLGGPMQRGFVPVANIDPHIERLGRLSERPELATVPILTFGHSNGTGFAAIFPSRRPERVIGWISYHSGGSWHLQFPDVEKVPGLVMHGHKDRWLENGQEQIVKRLRRERNAAVAMMLEANVGHGPVDADATWEFIAAFCEAAMRVRLNEDGSLKPVTIKNGWLGETYDRERGGQQDLAIAPYDRFPGDRSTANWLPDEIFAEIWNAYGKTNPGK